MGRHKAYDAWANIKARCLAQEHPSYHHYGGRGIKLADEWIDDPTAFRAYVESLPLYGPGMTLDRADNDGDYCRGNLRWATRAEQAVNRRKMANNSSGLTGVFWRVNTHPGGYTYTYASVHWVDGGKKKSKSFAVSAHGLLPAWAMAVSHRRAMIDKLNKAGAGYSAKHGQ